MRRNLAQVGVGFAVAALAAAALLVTGFFAGREVTALHTQSTATAAYPTLTPVPVTPIIFPDTLGPTETPASTMAAPAIVTSLPSPVPRATTMPRPTVVVLPTEVPRPPTSTAMPAPASPTPTAHVVREYWEKRADGNFYLVQQWSDGRFVTIKEQVQPTPIPTPTPSPSHLAFVWNLVLTAPAMMGGASTQPFGLRRGDVLYLYMRIAPLKHVDVALFKLPPSGQWQQGVEVLTQEGLFELATVQYTAVLDGTYQVSVHDAAPDPRYSADGTYVWTPTVVNLTLRVTRPNQP